MSQAGGGLTSAAAQLGLVAGSPSLAILQRSERILPEHGPRISEALADYLREEGLTIHTGVKALAVRQEDSEKVITAELDGGRREFRAEGVLMAVGRTANTRGMGLEEVGVQVDEGGFIVVDDQMQTSHPNIYAAGDVTDRPKFVYVAAEAGEVIQTAALAVKWGLENGFTATSPGEILFPYLTQVEGLKLAVIAYEKDVAQLSCCAG